MKASPFIIRYQIGSFLHRINAHLAGVTLSGDFNGRGMKLRRIHGIRTSVQMVAWFIPVTPSWSIGHP
jgi:hypothetical protein